MTAWADLLGEGSIGRQFLIWGVAYRLSDALLGPTMSLLEQQLNSLQPTAELSPEQLADMVIKSILDQADAADAASKSGINATRFNQMVLDAGEPPGMQDVLFMLRRGIIPETGQVGVTASYEDAFRTSRLRPEWYDAVLASKVVPITAGEAVAATLRNQIADTDGAQIALENGLDTTSFETLVNTAGRPPSVTELIELARRGVIPWGNLDPSSKAPNPTELSFAQGVYEGDTKDKWLPAYAALAEYRPPPRTIVTLLRDGAISVDLANQLFQQAGLTPALAQAYVASATSAKTVAHKNLALSTVLTLYEEKVITGAQATPLITQLGYDPTEAGFLLSLTDARLAQSSLRSATSRIGTYFVAHKISAAEATAALARLGVAGPQADALLANWQIEQGSNVKVLTPAQVVDAWYYKVYTQDQAQTELEGLGYTPYDAWTLLSIKNKGALPNPPAQGPPPIQ